MNTTHHATLALIACGMTTVIPVFFGKLRVLPTWLSLQALALGWLSLNQAGVGLHALAAGLEILLLRAWLVPHILRRALAQNAHSAQMDVMPSNLITWGVAVALLIVAFQFGDGARADLRALTLGLIAATVTLVFLVLATNREPLAQLGALLYLENAVVLFEHLLPHPWPLPVHLVLSGVYLGSAAVGVWLIRGMQGSTAPTIDTHAPMPPPPPATAHDPA